MTCGESKLKLILFQIKDGNISRDSVFINWDEICNKHDCDNVMIIINSHINNTLVKENVCKCQLIISYILRIIIYYVKFETLLNLVVAETKNWILEVKLYIDNCQTYWDVCGARGGSGGGSEWNRYTGSEGGQASDVTGHGTRHHEGWYVGSLGIQVQSIIINKAYKACKHFYTEFLTKKINYGQPVV